ncbi:ead/Ea22-like family protein [Klebsiella aerogenes]|uniref:ead/Ea22-like family protein n=1 Tax=Klebsiella aerogenes TaxID=548 RepID=UPI00291B64B0|nr:ead/Ea22-like family protein [Klebsiella aerogenes]MDU9141275.1 ead/Ea22-like family protein [Klebsiella aerogenes]
MSMNITELAQSLKAAAEKANPGPWRRASTLFNGITRGKFSLTKEDIIACTNEKRDAEFIALANPANILALVEALEKAQQVDEELCKLLPPGVEYMDPPDGGDVTPLEGVRRMVADYRQRISELESRTVTVKLPQPRRKTADDYVDETFGPCDLAAIYNACRLECEVKFKNSLASSGIKWEEA